MMVVGEKKCFCRLGQNNVRGKDAQKMRRLEGVRMCSVKWKEIKKLMKVKEPVVL